MLPAQYPINRIADVVDFFVNPAVLLAKTESIRGQDGPMKAMNQIPASRIFLLFCEGIIIIKHPTIAKRSRRAMMRRRDLFTRGVIQETARIEKRITAFVGIIIRTVCEGLKPNPSMIIAPN